MSIPDPAQFRELDVVQIRETIIVEELIGGEVEIKKGWSGTIVSDANTPEPFVEFTRYRERSILASIPVSNLELEKD